jgi:hypothetical protein
MLNLRQRLSAKQTTDFGPQPFRFGCFPVLLIQADQLFGGIQVHGIQVKRSLEVGFSSFIPPGCGIS